MVQRSEGLEGGMAVIDKRIEKLITEFLATQGMCVVATCSGDEPRASAVEFFPSGTVLYILTEGGRKTENIRKNPHVSVAIHTQFTGWDSIKGAQITGTAEVGEHGSKVFDEGVEAYTKRRNLKSITVPSYMHVLKITPRRIEYLDTTLRAKGMDVKHLLEY